MLKKVGDISAYHESCFKNENSEKFGKSLVLDCSGGSVGIMQFKVKKMNNIAHEDLQVKKTSTPSNILCHYFFIVKYSFLSWQ